MRLTFAPISEDDVRQIAAWMYEPPYDVYNLDTVPIETLLGSFLDPAHAYHAIRDEDGQLIAFCCFGSDARVTGGDYTAPALDVGIGLRPDLTGQGLGPSIIGSVLDYADAITRPTSVRVTIAAFNQRSIRAFEKVGFHEFARFVGGEPNEREWVQLVLGSGG